MIIDSSCAAPIEVTGGARPLLEVTRTPGRSRSAPAAGASTYSAIAEDLEAKHGAAAARLRARDVHADKPFRIWEKEQFSFGDFVDVINPLQHIPIIATIYRKFTDDRIGFAPRVIGGAIWGRIGGFVSGLVNAALEWFTGKDIGDHIYSALFERSGAGIETVDSGTVRMSAHPPAQLSLDEQEVAGSLDHSSVPRESRPEHDQPIDLGALSEEKPSLFVTSLLSASVLMATARLGRLYESCKDRNETTENSQRRHFAA